MNGGATTRTVFRIVGRISILISRAGFISRRGEIATGVYNRGEVAANQLLGAARLRDRDPEARLNRAVPVPDIARPCQPETDRASPGEAFADALKKN